jgi:hypothetical protein
MRELLLQFFGEYDKILNQKRNLQEKEHAGEDIGWNMHYNPYNLEENATEDESNEDRKRKAFHRDTIEEGIRILT